MRKVKIGIIGLGNLGIRHAENIMFRIPNAELTAAYTRTQSKLDRVHEEWGVPSVYHSLDDFFENREMEAVVIVSPSDQHCEHIVRAMERGLHVFSEKPLGTDLAQCRRAEQAVEAHPELIFQLGFMRRFDPSYAEAKRMIREGRIGRPFLVKCTSLDPDADMERFLNYAPISGGIFRDLTVHDVDLARWLLESDVTRITAAGGCYKYGELAQYGDVDNAAALMEFANGSIALFHSGRMAPHGSHIETEIQGTEGVLRISAVPEKNRMMIFDQHGAVQECTFDFLERWKEAFVAEMQSFVDCICENRRPEVTVYDGTKCTEVTYAAMEALHTHRTVELG